MNEWPTDSHDQSSARVAWDKVKVSKGKEEEEGPDANGVRTE